MITVDAMGDACPIPVIKTKKALAELNGSGELEVFVDNEIAVQNVSKMAANAGGDVASEQISEGKYRVAIRLAGDGTTGERDMEEKAEEKQAEKTAGKEKKHTIVVVSSDRMGSGNDELGKVLIKGFIFAVTQLDELPEQMLFYNGGAVLTCEGADTLEDLKNLEAQGVEILTCGTCLDYYGLKEKLQVGSVTNMYAIVEAMNRADKIIRP
ncbi:MAG: sulfurtransferase-like selenium metabolism protein YedF [Schaedlerella sp.]